MTPDHGRVLPGSELPDEVDERTYADGSCCGLKPDHEGCCAYFCSMCTGRGRTLCTYDDLGCDCGFCDGYGYCAECSGQGWFNDQGEPCWVGADEWGRVAS
jgi:hypothetical protein